MPLHQKQSKFIAFQGASYIQGDSAEDFNFDEQFYKGSDAYDCGISDLGFDTAISYDIIGGER